MRKYFPLVRWKNLLYAPLFLLLIVNMAITVVNASPPSVSLDPLTSIISAPGQTTTIKINVNNITDLYGYDIWVSYTSALLKVTEVKVVGTGQVVPTSTTQYVFYDTSVLGTVKVTVAFLETMGALSFNGTGTLLWITFNGTAVGISPLDVIDDETNLRDSLAGLIEIERPIVDGEIEVLPEFPAVIGTLLLLIATLAATFLGKIVWSRKRRG